MQKQKNSDSSFIQIADHFYKDRIKKIEVQPTDTVQTIIDNYDKRIWFTSKNTKHVLFFSDKRLKKKKTLEEQNVKNGSILTVHTVFDSKEDREYREYKRDDPFSNTGDYSDSDEEVQDRIKIRRMIGGTW